MGGLTYIGFSKVKKVFLGNTKVKKIYIGTNRVFSGTPEITIGGVLYNPTYEEVEVGYEIPITSNNTIVFNNFDNSSFKLTVCVIGGGGGGGTSYIDLSAYPPFATVAGGGGGEGGQVQTTVVSPAEGSSFSVTIGTGTTTTGNSTTGFGLTSVGGNNGGGGWLNGTGEPCYGGGGSGRVGADGGRGGTLAASPYIWISNPAAPGSNGTLFHGTYYGGGGGGYNYGGDGADGAGANNYGGGGHGSSTGPATTGKNGAVILLIEFK